MEHELPKVLDGVDEPVSVEELEAVVRRAGQRRRASLVAGAAGLLLLGGVSGALARGPATDPSRGFASSRGEPKPPPPTMASPAMFPGAGASLTPLFRREANGIAIRVYRGVSTFKSPAANAACMPDTIHGELSNAAAVGLAFAPDLKGDQLLLLGAGHFGLAEGGDVTWAAVRPGTASTVRLRLDAETDSMAPQEGVAFLAVPGSSGNGVVEGLDGDGKVVATQQLSALAYPPPDPACMPPPCVMAGHAAAAIEVAPAMPPSGPATTAIQTAPPPPVGGKAVDPALEKERIEAERNGKGPFVDESGDTAFACGPAGPYPVPPHGPPISGPGAAPPVTLPGTQTAPVPPVPTPAPAPAPDPGPAVGPPLGAVSPTTPAPTSAPTTAAPNASTSTTTNKAP